MSRAIPAYDSSSFVFSERRPAAHARSIGEALQVRRTAHESEIPRGNEDRPRRARRRTHCPVPANLAWLLEAQINLNGPACKLLFPTPRGRLWRERTFNRDVWKPTQEGSGLDIRPHECRHSYITHLRSSGINDADLAEISGHRVETMLSNYAHPLRQSHDAIRRVLG